MLGEAKATWRCYLSSQQFKCVTLNQLPSWTFRWLNSQSTFDCNYMINPKQSSPRWAVNPENCEMINDCFKPPSFWVVSCAIVEKQNICNIKFSFLSCSPNKSRGLSSNGNELLFQILPLSILWKFMCKSTHFKLDVIHYLKIPLNILQNQKSICNL